MARLTDEGSAATRSVMAQSVVARQAVIRSTVTRSTVVLPKGAPLAKARSAVHKFDSLHIVLSCGGPEHILIYVKAVGIIPPLVRGKLM